MCRLLREKVRFQACRDCEAAYEFGFIKHNTSPNQRLSLIILLSVRVQELIKIVKCSMKGGKLNESN